MIFFFVYKPFFSCCPKGVGLALRRPKGSPSEGHPTLPQTPTFSSFLTLLFHRAASLPQTLLAEARALLGHRLNPFPASFSV